MKRHPRKPPSESDRPGRVVGTAGRRVVVADQEGSRTCFLSGLRAVVGDRVRWTEAPGEGGKLTSVEDRDTALMRVDSRGEQQVLAANLEGLLVVASVREPAWPAGLVDRYLVAARSGGLRVAVVVSKIDLGMDPETSFDLADREALGIDLLRISSRTGDGVGAVRALLAGGAGPWAVVGPSGAGKTSLVSALLPGEEVGPVGEVSEYWDAGRHTTTHSRLFTLHGGGEIVDSPGIREFTPALLDPIAIRDHFPGIGELRCKYRDCLHRPDEEGCAAGEGVEPARLASYRRLLAETGDISRRRGYPTR